MKALCMVVGSKMIPCRSCRSLSPRLPKLPLTVPPVLAAWLETSAPAARASWWELCVGHVVAALTNSPGLGEFLGAELQLPALLNSYHGFGPGQLQSACDSPGTAEELPVAEWCS